MIRIFPDAQSLAREAATFFVQLAGAAATQRGRFSVALSGGSTPRSMYRILAEPRLSEEVDWHRAHIFWGDERCVPPDHPRNNAWMARRLLLDHVPVPPVQVHPMVCNGNPAEAADRYDALLRDFFAGNAPAFDLILLGLGENGHTASLFPHDQALLEKDRWAVEVPAAGRVFPRVTLTLPLINQARMVVFLVTGAGKSAVLKEVLTGIFDPLRLPAQSVRPGEKKLVWLADQEAAAELDAGQTETTENREADE